MRFLIRMLLFATTISCAFAQLDSNSITVTASRSAGVQPDQAVFAITVETPLDVGLNDVLAAVEAVGIMPANFVNVNSPQILLLQPGLPAQPPTLQWTFAVPIPLAKTKDMVSALADLQQTLAQNHSPLRIRFGIQGTQASPQVLQTQTCPVADLIADARAQAQKLAGAAGLGVGNILALSTATGSAGALYTGFLSVPAAPCAAMVKFALR